MLINFLDPEGKLTHWPSQPELKYAAIRYLASKFELNRQYPEVAVNGILRRWHKFDDPALLRRELFERGFVQRTSDGRAYWKAAPGLISSEWQTERLVISDAIETDAAQLNKVYASTSYLAEWEGVDRNPPDYITKAIRKEVLPPKGDPARAKFQTIRLKENGEVIGFFELYHGHPKSDIFYLGALRLRTDQQKLGLGIEAINELKKEVQAQNYSEIYLAVSLKNWPGLRFWLSAGFQRITKISGDREFKQNSFALIELAQKI